MWEEVADKIVKNGGEIDFHQKVNGIVSDNIKVSSVESYDESTGKSNNWGGNYFISTMPVKELVNAIKNVPNDVLEVADGLMYRDFITVGLLLKKLSIENQSKIKSVGNIVPDNWIYIQEKDVKLGRVQIFNNWSPYMVDNPKIY